MKKRTYRVQLVAGPSANHQEFEVPKDEKWRFVGMVNERSVNYLVFITWKITENEFAGILWSCS